MYYGICASSEFRNCAGNWGEFKILPIDKLTHLMKDHVERSHLTKFDAFRVNRDKVMDLETYVLKRNIRAQFYLIISVSSTILKIVCYYMHYTVIL